MTKTTTKRRKRKNVKMRRTIRKTIAAIIMIMAVVVAAIPVEQLGTMQAATQEKSANLGAVYDEYMANPTNSDIDFSSEAGISDVTSYDSSSAAKKTQIMIQTSSSPLTYRMDSQFDVVQRNNGTGYVIVNYNQDLGGGDITIGEKLATDYFVITNKFLDEFKSQISTEEYKVVFSDAGTSETQQVGYNYNASGTPGSTGNISIPATLDLNNPDFTQ